MSDKLELAVRYDALVFTRHGTSNETREKKIIRHKDKRLLTIEGFRGGKYIEVLQYQMDYCRWLSSRRIRDNGRIPDLQEYIRDIDPRCDHPIAGGSSMGDQGGKKEAAIFLSD